MQSSPTIPTLAVKLLLVALVWVAVVVVATN
jgi:hypothetical protein